MKRVLSVLLLACFFFAQSVTVRAQENSLESLIHEVLALVHVKEQVDQIPGQLEVMLEQKKQDVDSEEYRIVRDIFVNGFSPDVIYDYVFQTFNNSLFEEQLKRLKIVFQSDFMKRVSDLEKEASKPEAYLAMGQFAQSLRENPPSQARVKMARDIDDAVGGSELFFQVSLSTFKVIFNAFNAVADESQKLSATEVAEIEAKFIQESRIEALNTMMVSMLFTYRSLSDEELGQYLEILRGDDVFWFNRMSADALKEALERSVTIVGQQLEVKLPR